VMLCPSCARVRVRVGGVAVHEHVECGKSDQERLAEGGVDWCLTCGQITANLPLHSLVFHPQTVRTRLLATGLLAVTPIPSMPTSTTTPPPYALAAVPPPPPATATSASPPPPPPPPPPAPPPPPPPAPPGHPPPPPPRG
jgi:hypothetical protein